MRATWRAWTNKLFKRMTLYFVLLALVAMALISVVTNILVDNTQKSSYIQANLRSMQWVCSMFNVYIDGVAQQAQTLGNDNTFTALLGSILYDEQSQNYVNDRLVSLFRSNSDAQKVTFYFPSLEYPGEPAMHHDYLYTISHYIPKPHLYGVREKIQGELLLDIAEVDGERLFSSFSSGRVRAGQGTQSSYLCFVKTYRDQFVKNKIGMLAVYLGDYYIENIIKTASMAMGERTLLFAKDGAMLYDSDWPDAGAQTFFDAPLGSSDVQWNGERSLLMSVQSQNGYRLMKLIPFSTFIGSLTSLKVMIVCIVAALLVAFLVGSSLVAGRLTKPLDRLARHMERAGKGDFTPDFHYEGNDEIGILSNQFNSMVLEIRELINRQYLAELNARNAQLSALEAQVNPHFLYNCMQAISCEALRIGSESIYQMTSALSYSMRYLVNCSEKVCVADEVRNINSYFILQSARFGNRLRMVMRIPEEMNEIEVPKLMLQIVVENSIKHGMGDGEQPLEIVISARLDEDMALFEISDNGRGVTCEKVREILGRLDEPDGALHQSGDTRNTGIGLRNLKSRIQLLYGGGFVRFAARDGHALTEIGIPMNAKRREDER